MTETLVVDGRARKSEDADLSAVKTLQKALSILDAFAAAERPLTVAEAAVRADVTRPTAYRLIQTLVAEGYLSQDPGDGRIVPGYSVLQLAASLLDTSMIRLESLPHLENLARVTGERVSLGILHRHKMLYHAGVEKPSLPTIYSRFGRTSPAYCSAIGKSILAYLPEPQLRAYLQQQPLVRYTETTITDEAALRAELAEVRRRGFAVDREEHSIGLACVGSPVLIHGRPVAAVAVTGRSFEPLLTHSGIVQHTAEVISHVLSRGA
jgi:DNA-binding IclR family transcriptional regulator